MQESILDTFARERPMSRRSGVRGAPWTTATVLLSCLGVLALAQAAPPAHGPLDGELVSGGQAARVKDIAPGRLLVAARSLVDPNFAETVVLLTEYNEQGAMGLIVNRPTEVPLSRVFRTMKQASGHSDPAYLGGPVAVTGVLGLLRSQVELAQSQHVFADVYLISTRGLLEEMLKTETDPRHFRIYFGYAGWGSGQLERETELGSWHVFQGDADLVFDPEPDTVWLRQIQRTEGRLVSFPSPSMVVSEQH